MIEISLKTLMINSPCPPYDDEKKNKNQIPAKNLYSYHGSKTVCESTIFKMFNNEEFWENSKNKINGTSFLSDFQRYKKNKKNDRGLNYVDGKYRWTKEEIIALWSLMVSYKYYKFNAFSKIKIGSKKAETVEEIIKNTCSNKLTIMERKNNLTLTNKMKKNIIDLKGEPRKEFFNVMDHVKSLSEEIISSLNTGKFDWNCMFRKAGFPKEFETCVSIYEISTEIQDMLKGASKIYVQNFIINSFYPQADDDSPISRQLQSNRWDIVNNDIEAACNKLCTINLTRLHAEQQDKLRTIIDKINKF